MSEQSQAGADLREKALKEENEKLQGRIAELERRLAQLQKQMEDVKGDEAHAKETLHKCEVRLLGSWPECGSLYPSLQS